MTNEQWEVIHTYTRKQAIADGMQFKFVGEFETLAQQHYKHPVYMTSSVYEIVKKAVDNKKHCNDYLGVFHDILWMSRVYKRPINDSTVQFRVKIVGAGRKSLFDFYAVCGATDIDDPTPCITIMSSEDM